MEAFNKIKSLMTVKNLGIAMMPVAFVASGVLFVNSSTAAFSAQTVNEVDTWTSGKVSLANDHASALFAPTGIKPGYTESHCITVTSNSDIPVTVKMYSKNVTSNVLSSNLQVNITEGSGGVNTDGVNGSPGSCSGFTPDGTVGNVYSGTLDGFAVKSNFATAGGSAVLAPNGSKQYKITVSLPDTTDNTVQAKTASASFVWEAQS